jgi:hypothetical protein
MKLHHLLEQGRDPFDNQQKQNLLARKQYLEAHNSQLYEHILRLDGRYSRFRSDFVGENKKKIQWLSSWSSPMPTSPAGIVVTYIVPDSLSADNLSRIEKKIMFFEGNQQLADTFAEQCKKFMSAISDIYHLWTAVNAEYEGVITKINFATQGSQPFRKGGK